MGFTPAQVGEMSLWEFMACADGVAASRGAEPEPEPMSLERLRELSAGA